MFLSKRMKSIGIPSCALLPLPEKGIYLPRFTLISCSLTKKKYRPHYTKAFNFLLTNYPSHSPLPGTSSLLQPPPPLPPSLQPHSHSPLPTPTPTLHSHSPCTVRMYVMVSVPCALTAVQLRFPASVFWTSRMKRDPLGRSWEAREQIRVCLSACLSVVRVVEAGNKYVCVWGGAMGAWCSLSFLLCIDDNVRFYFHAMRGMVNAFISLCIL